MAIGNDAICVEVVAILISNIELSKVPSFSLSSFMNSDSSTEFLFLKKAFFDKIADFYIVPPQPMPIT